MLQKSDVSGSGAEPGQALLACRSREAVQDHSRRRRLAEGQYLSERLASGLWVQGSNSQELQGCQVASTVKPATVFVCVLEGELEFEYGTQCFNLCAGEGVAIHLSCTEMFRRRLQPGRQLSKLHLALGSEWWHLHRADTDTAAALNMLAAEHLNHVYWRLTPEQKVLCARLLNTENETDGLLRRLQIEHLASGLLLQLLLQLETVQGRVESAQAAAGPTAEVECALLLLEEQLLQPLCISTLARQLGVSMRVLQRRFKGQTGLSVSDYVRRRRLEMARQCLREENRSIGEVAHYIGFGHVSNFTTAFRRHFGLTPAEYRRQIAAAG